MADLFFELPGCGGPMSLTAGVDSTRFRFACPEAASEPGAGLLRELLAAPPAAGLADEVLGGTSREPAGESRSGACWRVLFCCVAREALGGMSEVSYGGVGGLRGVAGGGS